MISTVEMPIAGRVLSIETGRLAEQAGGAVLVRYGDTVILATDGIRDGFADGLAVAGTPQMMADAILAKHAKGNDDALVLVARYVA